jgi:hypothetical protein
LNSSDVIDLSDITLKLTLKTDIPKVYTGGISIDNNGKITFTDLIPKILKSGTTFQVLNSVQNSIFLTVAPINNFNSEIPTYYDIGDQVIYQNNIYQNIQAYTQSTTDDTTYPTNTIYWGEPNYLIVEQLTSNETIFNAEIYLTTNVLEFYQPWDTNRSITMATLVQKYKQDLEIFNVELSYEHNRLSSENDDKIIVDLIYPSNYVEVDYILSTTSSILTQTNIYYEKLVETKETPSKERNTSLSELYKYDVVITDLDEFGLYVDMNGVPYFTETAFYFSGVTVDLPRTIDRTLRSFYNNYYIRFYRIGIEIELVWTGIENSIYVNTIRFKTQYPNVPLNFNVRVGTTADYYINHSYVVFYRIGGQLKITINERVYLETFDTSIETTLSNWITNHGNDILFFGIIVEVIGQTLFFKTKQQSTRIDYKIEIGEQFKPGEIPFETFKNFSGNGGALITSNQIIHNQLNHSFEESGFATGMLVAINNSLFIPNNVEYNILFLDPDKMVLSYQGPFWGTTQSQQSIGFAGSAFSDGFGYDPTAINLTAAITATVSLSDYQTINNTTDLLYNQLSETIYIIGDSLQILDSFSNIEINQITLGSTGNSKGLINSINGNLYILGDSIFSVVDIFTQQLIATFSVPYLNDFVINTKTGEIYGGGSGSVYVWDTDNNLTNTIPINSPVKQMVYNSDDNDIYVSNINELVNIDGVSKTITQTYSSSDHLFYNQINGRMYGFDSVSLFSLDQSGKNSILSIGTASVAYFSSNPNTFTLYVSHSDGNVYIIDAVDNIVSQSNINTYGELQWSQIDGNFYIIAQSGTPSVIVYNTDIVDTIPITNYGQKPIYNSDRKSIGILIPSEELYTDLKINIQTTITQTVNELEGDLIEDGMFGTLGDQWIDRDGIWLAVREYIRKPRENFNNEIYVKYRMKWLDDQVPEVFLYDITGEQLKPNGELTYIGETPLPQPRLRRTKNSDINRIQDSSAQQTIFPEIVYELPHIDDETEISFTPSPFEFFIGFQSQLEGVVHSTLILEKIEDISFEIETTPFMNKITFKNEGSFGTITLDTASNQSFYEKGLNPGQLLKITQKDISNKKGQAISLNMGKIFKIRNIFNNIIEVDYIKDTIADQKTVIDNFPENGKITYFLTTFTIVPKEIARFEIYGETEIEDIRYKINLSNEGKNVKPKDVFIFRTYDIQEQGIDWHFLNKKRKEMLLIKNEIYPYIGSYKAIINAINFFGYNELQLNEYYRNINTDSPNFGKLFKVEIPDIFDNTVPGWKETDFLKHTLPNPNYDSTNLFNLTFNITDKEGNNQLLFSLDEVLIKLTGLKNWLEGNVVPLTHDIMDITGKASFVGEQTIRHTSHNVTIININDSMTPINFDVNELYVLPVNSGSTVYNVVVEYSVGSGELPDSYLTSIRTYQIFPEWDPFKTYTIGDKIRYLGKQFVSEINNNKLNNPLKFNSVETYTPDREWRRGDIVEYNRDYYKYISATNSFSGVPYNNMDWDVITQWKVIDLPPVQSIEEWRRSDNLNPFNFTVDTNIDPYVVIKVTSDNGYGETYTFEKSIEVRYDADSTEILNLF